MMESEIKLSVINLSCIRQHKSLFANISFQLKAGSVLLIEGPNGSGKSSLLRLLTGLATTENGEILWQGKCIHEQRETYWNHLHYVGHTNGIKLGLTVTENLRLLCHLHLANTLNAFEPVLSQLQLSAYHHTEARYLSAGQKRRLALAKLFLCQKTLWILDEPLTALDQMTQDFFLSQLNAHVEKGGIAIISSHHPMRFPQVSLQTLRLTSC